MHVAHRATAALSFAANAPSKPSRKGSESFSVSKARAGSSASEPANDLFVFFALKAACAVNQYAAGFQQAEYSARDDQLFVGHSAEIFRSQSPSHVNPSAHDSGICAWRI